AQSPEQLEAGARRLVQRLVLAAQAAVMLEQAPPALAQVFADSRGDGECGRVYGALAGAGAQKEILERAWPA
ncbi:MAG: DNA alkylation response protein, partial [Noviherbaspirillum sp.]